jgi:hypothetical protein
MSRAKKVVILLEQATSSFFRLVNTCSARGLFIQTPCFKRMQFYGHPHCNFIHTQRGAVAATAILYCYASPSSSFRLQPLTRPFSHLLAPNVEDSDFLFI